MEFKMANMKQLGNVYLRFLVKNSSRGISLFDTEFRNKSASYDVETDIKCIEVTPLHDETAEWFLYYRLTITEQNSKNMLSFLEDIFQNLATYYPTYTEAPVGEVNN